MCNYWLQINQEAADPARHGRFDVAGAVLAALALAGITDALIEAPAHGLFRTALSGTAGILAGAGFVVLERRRGRPGSTVTPMLPLHVFASRQFTAVNAVTFVTYSALSGTTFLLILQLQVVSGYSPLAAGLALLPPTLLMLLLSAVTINNNVFRAGQAHPAPEPRARSLALTTTAHSG